VEISQLPPLAINASSQMARFRPDYALLAELRAMDGEDDYHQIGVIPDEWFASRFIGTAEVGGNYADLYSPAWVSHLRSRLNRLRKNSFF
jgi:hypothetical protein